jgi:hypothetical protein
MPCTRSRCPLASVGKLTSVDQTASGQPHARRSPELGLPRTASSRWVTTCPITALRSPGTAAEQIGQVRGGREKMLMASDHNASDSRNGDVVAHVSRYYISGHMLSRS